VADAIDADGLPLATGAIVDDAGGVTAATWLSAAGLEAEGAGSLEATPEALGAAPVELELVPPRSAITTPQSTTTTAPTTANRRR
jgi:hypothetical protein